MPRSPRKQALVDELLRRFGAALRGSQLYAAGHPLVARNINAFSDVAARLLEDLTTLTIALVGDEVVVGGVPAPRGTSTLGDLLAKLASRGIERISIDAGVTGEELSTLIAALRHRLESGDAATTGKPFAWPDLPHIRVGLVRVDERVETSLADMETIRRLYTEAATAAEGVWETAGREGVVDPDQVREVVSDLAQAVTQNPNALTALTTIRSSDRYTFTHMVNVSILTMAQARGLGIDGALLREFGVAGLMHDIGKVHTPAAILTKPDRLDEHEMAVIKRHVIDGATILRRTANITPLAPIVAFEHHLRASGRGYPEGVKRPSLNLATVLCTISDVYDAMRSKRPYQMAHPTDRILAVLKARDGHEFDQDLVRRFVQLMGIYPVGTMVRMNTGVLAVVIRAYPPDTHRPRVRVVMGADGRRLENSFDLDLWDVEPRPDRPSSIAAPAESPDPSFDPLSVIQ